VLDPGVTIEKVRIKAFKLESVWSCQAQLSELSVFVLTCLTSMFLAARPHCNRNNEDENLLGLEYFWEPITVKKEK
jgi:hypothetical protein